MGLKPSSLLGTVVPDAARPLLAWKLEAIRDAFIRFDEKSRTPGIDLAVFTAVFGLPARESQAAFTLFAEEGRPRVDALLVFAVMSLASQASATERRQFAFQFYDFDGNMNLSKDELVIMLRSCLRGMAIVTSGTAPSIAQCEAMAAEAFAAADATGDAKLSYAEFSGWIRGTEIANEVLACFDRNGKLTNTMVRPAKSTTTAPAASAAAAAGGPTKPAAAKPKAPGRAAAPRTAAATAGESKQPSPPSPKKPVNRRKDDQPAVTKGDVLALRTIFNQLDRDQSGTVSFTEFANTIEEGLANHVGSMFMALDRDADGQVAFADVLKLMYSKYSDEERAKMLEWVTEAPAPAPPPKPKLTEAQMTELRALFDSYDLDRSNSIDVAELGRIMLKTGAFTTEEVNRMFAEADVDQSATITFEEFKEFIKESMYEKKLW